MTNKQMEIYNRYRMSDMVDIYDAYDKPSRAKVNIWKSLVNEVATQEWDSPLKIIGRNSSIFSAGYTRVNKETGVIEFVYITPSKTDVWEI